MTEVVVLDYDRHRIYNIKWMKILKFSRFNFQSKQ